MFINRPTIQERLDAIRERVGEMTGNHSDYSYPWPDPTDERIKKLEKENAKLRKRLTVTDDLVERVARAFYEHPTLGVDVSLTPSWDRLTTTSPDIATAYRNRIRAALDVVFGTGEKA